MAKRLTPEELRRLARLGAARRLEELRQEEAAIRAAFPGIDAAIAGRRRGRPPASADSSGGARKRRRRQRKMSAAEKRAVSERMKKVLGGTTQGTLMPGRALVFAAAAMAIATSSFAQPKEPIGRFVVDVRAASVGLPTAVGWVPVVPEGTEVPARSLGLEVGAHVYVARLGPMTLGVGATYLTARKSSVPPEIAEGPTPPPPGTIPEVTTRMSSLAPQVSLNFGHANGWSYISVGLGRIER